MVNGKDDSCNFWYIKAISNGYYFLRLLRLAQPSSAKSGSSPRRGRLSFWKNCFQSSFFLGPRAAV